MSVITKLSIIYILSIEDKSLRKKGILDILDILPTDVESRYH